MIRGISKNVIEITDTKNECFERAILFIRPAKKPMGPESLKTRAGEYLSNLSIRTGLLSPKRWGFTLLKLGGAAAAGAAVTALIMGG